jgi:hypothetical protein
MRESRRAPLGGSYQQRGIGVSTFDLADGGREYRRHGRYFLWPAHQQARKARRDDRYKEFIAGASKAYGEAIVSNEPNVQELVALYAMISRMRVQSPPQTVACAEKIMRATIDTYLAPGKTIREFHELVQSGSGIDLLKDFSEFAREELRAFTTL